MNHIYLIGYLDSEADFKVNASTFTLEEAIARLPHFQAKYKSLEFHIIEGRDITPAPLPPAGSIADIAPGIATA